MTQGSGHASPAPCLREATRSRSRGRSWTRQAGRERVAECKTAVKQAESRNGTGRCSTVRRDVRNKGIFRGVQTTLLEPAQVPQLPPAGLRQMLVVEQGEKEARVEKMATRDCLAQASDFWVLDLETKGTDCSLLPFPRDEVRECLAPSSPARVTFAALVLCDASTSQHRVSGPFLPWFMVRGHACGARQVGRGSKVLAVGGTEQVFIGCRGSRGTQPCLAAWDAHGQRL